MRPVLYVTHIAGRGANLLTRALAAHGLALDERCKERGDALPPLDGYAGLVCMGGHESVLDLPHEPFLQAEREIILDALDRRLPMLGICLGAQLLADAAGGGVERLPERLVAVLDLVPEGPVADDPVFRHLPPALPVLEWHGDAIVPPPTGDVLAETTGTGCSVFRAAPEAWGTQIHLELDMAVVDRMLADPASLAELREAGADPAELARTLPGVLARQAEASEPVLDAFAALVAAREGAATGGRA